MVYVWRPVGLLFGAIPWAVVLAMFMARPNRCPQAWRLWIPLLGGVTLLLIARSLLAFWNQTGADMLHRVFVSLSFGACLIWLLSPYLVRVPRPVRFFGYWLLIFFAGVVHGLDLGVTSELFPFLVMAAMVAACVALALTLSALSCGRRYTVMRFGNWVFVWVVVVWVGIAASIILMAGGLNGPPIGEFTLVALSMAAATFLAIFPFLLISRYQTFYADRLRGLVEPLGVSATSVPEDDNPPQPGASSADVVPSK